MVRIREVTRVDADKLDLGRSHGYASAGDFARVALRKMQRIFIMLANVQESICEMVWRSSGCLVGLDYADHHAARCISLRGGWRSVSRSLRYLPKT